VVSDQVAFTTINNFLKNLAREHFFFLGYWYNMVLATATNRPVVSPTPTEKQIKRRRNVLAPILIGQYFVLAFGLNAGAPFSQYLAVAAVAIILLMVGIYALARWELQENRTGDY